MRLSSDPAPSSTLDDHGTTDTTPIPGFAAFDHKEEARLRAEERLADLAEAHDLNLPALRSLRDATTGPLLTASTRWMLRSPNLHGDYHHLFGADWPKTASAIFQTQMCFARPEINHARPLIEFTVPVANVVVHLHGHDPRRVFALSEMWHGGSAAAWWAAQATDRQIANMLTFEATGVTTLDAKRFSGQFDLGFGDIRRLLIRHGTKAIRTCYRAGLGRSEMKQILKTRSVEAVIDHSTLTTLAALRSGARHV